MNASISAWEIAVAFVEVNGVAHHEQVAGVALDFRPLVLPEGVLDGELVKAELVLQLLHLLGRRRAVVDPHDRVGTFEVVGDVRDGVVLGLEDALAVHPGVGHAATR